MIFTERTITVVNDSATINKPLILYRGDKNIELKITIAESQFKFRNTDASNVIETTDASYAQLVINTPYNSPIFSDVAVTKNGAVIFVITEAMIDEIREVGAYEIQIRLLDDNKQSRASIPPVSNAIEIREPIAIEDGSAVDSNAVNVAKVNRALTTTSAPLEAFDSQGNYIKKTWGDGDPITDAALNKMEAAIDGVNKKIGNNRSQIKEIKNNIQNIGQPTDEQVATAINQAIANGDIVAGGLTSTAQTLLVNILRSAVFTSDQSANITLLQSELAKGNSGGSSETTKYVITNTLNNATTSNNATLVDANSSYTAIIRENDGYTLDTITVTMGGTDITSSAVSGTTITITSVTGNVVITVTTTESGSSSGGGMVTNGLENYFDFRTAEYNNKGAGGSTIINATQGNGSLYTWATDRVTEQGDYGMIVARSMMYNGTSVGTTTTSLGTSFTVIFKCYITMLGSPLFDNGYASLSNVSKLTYRPKYKTTSGTGNVDGVGLGERLSSGYDTVTLMVDGNICKLYFGTTLMQTNDGSTISDFQGWYDQLPGITMLSAKGYLSQMAVYNKALSEVELVDMIEYLSSLEVK